MTAKAIVQEGLRVFVEAFLASIAAIIMGYLVDLIFLNTKASTRWIQAVALLMAQLALDVIIIWLVLLLSHHVRKMMPDRREGMIGFLVFTVIFFVAQPTIARRIAYIYGYRENTVVPV